MHLRRGRETLKVSLLKFCAVATASYDGLKLFLREFYSGMRHCEGSIAYPHGNLEG